jgi:hypothetical protein
MVGLGTTVLLGFEEPNTTMLLFSSLLFLAAPVALAVYLMMTKELTPRARRTWIRELTSARSGQALSAYLSSHDRAAAAETFAKRTAR